MSSKEYENFVISRVELFVLNEPSRSKLSTRARSTFPPLSQHLITNYENLCESQLQKQILLNRSPAGCHEAFFCYDRFQPNGGVSKVCDEGEVIEVEVR